MDFDDMMPVGKCIVCDTMLDHANAGFCADCNGAFCWSSCGGWHGNDHCCDNCRKADEDEI